MYGSGHQYFARKIPLNYNNFDGPLIINNDLVKQHESNKMIPGFGRRENVWIRYYIKKKKNQKR